MAENTRYRMIKEGLSLSSEEVRECSLSVCQFVCGRCNLVPGLALTPACDLASGKLYYFSEPKTSHP